MQMKTIVVYGKKNETTEEISEFLHGYFRVELCTEDAQQALGMIKVVEPDMVVMSLIDFTPAEQELFSGIKSDFPSMPVVSVGTVEERMRFGKYYVGGQMENLPRPLNIEALFSAVCRKLGVDEQAVKDEAEEANVELKKVLVVDDNAATLRSIKFMLNGKYDITLVNSGMKALTTIAKSRPDVVLLDYEMPVCDGRQTLEMIRSEPDLADIPVIFLTSVNDKDNIEAVIKLRPAGYLLKPAVPAKLIKAIEAALAGTPQQQ